MEQQIFVAGFIGFFSVIGITLPIYRAYLAEKKENDSRKEKERFERYCRKRGKIFKSAIFMGIDIGHPYGDNKTGEHDVPEENIKPYPTYQSTSSDKSFSDRLKELEEFEAAHNR